MAMCVKESLWSQLIRFTNSIGRSKIERSVNEREQDEWRILHQHSVAKISKTIAEQYYSPNPLPPALSQRLNERIESSRNQLIRILKEQYSLLDNDLPFVIQ